MPAVRRSPRRLGLLTAVLGAQLLVAGAFIWAAATGFGFLGELGATAHRAADRDLGAATLGGRRSARFDARRAWRELLTQVAIGPRPAGSPTLRQLAARLRRELPHGRFEPLGPAHPGLQNIIGTLPGRLPAVVLGAHYDTKDIPGTAPRGGNGYVGANDGAGGTAAVVELARDLRRARRPGGHQLRFVLFDGEEAPPGSPDFYSGGDRGSKAYVAAHRREVGAMILLDFVANRRLSIPREAGSDRGLWARLRAAAAAVGDGTAFPDRTTGEILDDHTPFARAGIPAVDLIDFDYPCWHRACDRPDQLSQGSLQVTGQTVLKLLGGM
ncbi:MAG: Zn-dependent exopeptidase M28 [Actinobacteria bacterium]|nr:MAG: Zn-dependent exopeptidase M28 [Actinomycetota bacterium]